MKTTGAEVAFRSGHEIIAQVIEDAARRSD